MIQRMNGYLYLQHCDEKHTAPFKLGDHLYIQKPDDMEHEETFLLTIPNIPEHASDIWVSVWMDYAYGETMNVAGTRDKIIKKSIEQLRRDYDLNDDVPAKWSMDRYASDTFRTLKKRDWVVLKHYPLEPDNDGLFEPALVIKHVQIVR